MKRMTTSALAMSLVALASATPAMAQEAPGVQPFITAEHYMDNISLDKFRSNPRSYFRSEAAFNLLRDYVGSEINQELTSAEFIALLRSDEYVVVRDCSMNESINTGGLYWNGQSWEFSWFVRSCRAGEQIIQFKLGNQRIDLISLNCLNAVEPKVTVTFEFNRRVPPAIPRRPVVSMTTTITSSPDDYRGQPTLLMGAAGPRDAGGDLTIDVLGTAGAGSVSSAAAQSGGGNCTPSCPTTPDQ